MFEMASLLVQHGADVNAHDCSRHTALEECSRLWGGDDQLRFANLFLGAGAVVRLGDDEDLYYAIANGTLALVVRLLDAVRPEAAIAELPEEFFVWRSWARSRRWRSNSFAAVTRPARGGRGCGSSTACTRPSSSRGAPPSSGARARAVRSGPIVGYWQHLAAAPESKAAACVLERLTAKRQRRREHVCVRVCVCVCVTFYRLAYAPF